MADRLAARAALRYAALHNNLRSEAGGLPTEQGAAISSGEQGVPADPGSPDSGYAGETGWADRRQAAQSNWTASRSGLLAQSLEQDAPPTTGTLCHCCGGRAAIVSCMDCRLGGVLLCTACDSEQHPYAHFHRRSRFDGGFYSPIPAQLEFTGDGAEAFTGTELPVKVLPKV